MTCLPRSATASVPPRRREPPRQDAEAPGTRRGGALAHSGPEGLVDARTRGSRRASSALPSPQALAIVSIAALLAAGCGPEPPRLATGDPAPPFALPALAGGQVSIPAGLAGQVVAVRFWADWCPFCESEMRDLEPVYQRHRERGFRVLAVNVRQDRETAERFIRRLGVSYDVLLDGEGRAARGYGVIGLPTTFFIGRDGRLGPRILGESSPEVVEAILGDLL